MVQFGHLPLRLDDQTLYDSRPEKRAAACPELDAVYCTFDKKCMSQAFVKENEEQWLHEIPPTTAALINYLTRENNGVRVYEIKTTSNKQGKPLHHMSNGLAYFVNDQSQWTIEW